MALLQSLRGCPTLNTETITPTLCNLTPPPLERQGGREGKSIHCLGPLLLRALVFAASAGFDQAALVARRFRLTSDLASSHDSAQLLRIQKRLHKPHLPPYGKLHFDTRNPLHSSRDTVGIHDTLCMRSVSVAAVLLPSLLRG